MGEPMNPVRHFSQNYTEARANFLAAAQARGAAVTRHVHPAVQGAQGEELSMDLALLGDSAARELLLVSSGTHGAEGFCGSGCQTALLHDDSWLRSVERSGVAVLLLHAVNPHGFSNVRRVNEDNADLNRNFIDFTQLLPVNSAYTELHELLLPPAWPPIPENEAKLGAWIATHGAKAYQAAISGGQYQYPAGMFFGGQRPTWSNQIIRATLRKLAGTCRRLGWIDVHTGLGPSGHGEKIYAGRDDAAEIARAGDWWGKEVTSFFDGSSTSAKLTGVICGAAYDECPNTQLTAIGLEFGTLPLEQVLQALRADHWLQVHPEAPAALHTAIKREVRDAFYTDTDDWKRRVYAQTVDATLKAVQRLANAAIAA